MNFSIAESIRRLLAPRHELSCSRGVWRRLLAMLYVRGRQGRCESGAFLLGTRREGRARIVDFVLYDDLDPGCLDSGIIRFDGRYYDALWELCNRRKLIVVADVHTHPGGTGQSESDRAHPMISRAGHVALILPRYAGPPVHRSEVGMYRYEGAKRWYAVPTDQRLRFLHVGI